MRYHTFDLTLAAMDTPHEYHLLAQFSTQSRASGRTKINLSQPAFIDWLNRLEQNMLTPAEVQAFGATLHQALFVGEINLLFQRALGETIGKEELGVRLRLSIHPPELAALPWEFLYSPERHLFLAASVETPLSRYIDLPEPVRKLACPEKVHILVVIPKNSGLNTTAERQALEEVSAQLGNKLTVDFLEGEVTSAVIRAALRKKEYHIFHYAGHGSFENDGAFIHLDHIKKRTEPMPAGLFAQFFLDYPSIRLVFLNACQGATRSSHQALVGAAPQLALRGVPAVVAMQYPIANDEAILFASEFYAELCHERTGGQVEIAISRARKALLQERPGRPAFGNPVLYLRAEDGRLWEAKGALVAEERAAPPAKPPEKKSLLERWQLWVGIIGGILVIIGGLLELPEKVGKFFVSKKTSDSARTVPAPAVQQLRGQIRDAATNRYLDGVIVLLPELGKRDTTNDIGIFEFDSLEVAASTPISLQAMKPDYVSINDDPWPGTHLNQYKMLRTK